MINSRNIKIDLAHPGVNDSITLHEGDVNGTELVLHVYDNNYEFDLSGCTAEYDATIVGCLAEEGAAATIPAGTNTIKVPVTANMTALSGQLLISVKIKKNNDILTVCIVTAAVKKAVINGSTIIDINSTVAQKLNNVLYQAGAAYADITTDRQLPSGAVRLKDATNPKQIYTFYSPQGLVLGYAFVVPLGGDGLVQYLHLSIGIQYRVKLSAQSDFGSFELLATKSYVDNIVGDIESLLAEV